MKTRRNGQVVHFEAWLHQGGSVTKLGRYLSLRLAQDAILRRALAGKTARGAAASVWKLRPGEEPKLVWRFP